MLRELGQKQLFERSLGHSHLLILETLLKRQEEIETYPGNILLSAIFGSLFYHEDAGAVKCHLESFLWIISTGNWPCLLVCQCQYYPQAKYLP